MLLSDESKVNLYYQAINFLEQLSDSKEYQEVKNRIDDLMMAGKWNEMNLEIIKYFMSSDSKLIIKKHASIRYFLDLSNL